MSVLGSTIAGAAARFGDRVALSFAGGHDVTFAELQVRLRVNGRVRAYPVRLWPDRCDLAPTPLGERLSRCLSRWGLAT